MSHRIIEDPVQSGSLCLLLHIINCGCCEFCYIQLRLFYYICSRKNFIMPIFTIFLAIFLSIFSTAVMSYISMATPIGPWIAPTLTLIALLLVRGLCSGKNTAHGIMLAVFSGSVGGILATGLGFSFPTLYFLKPDLFNAWVNEPWYFIFTVAGLSFVSGALGVLLANFFEERLVIEENMAFPIGQLVQSMVAVQHSVRKAYELVAGFIGTTLFCILQDGIGVIKGIIPGSLTLLSSVVVGPFKIPTIQFDLWPMFWAIGFITGHVIAIPLAVGAIAKVFLVDPLNSTAVFNNLSSTEFVLAFCSGMVLCGVVLSFVTLPKLLIKIVKGGMAQVHNGGTFSMVRTVMHTYWVQSMAILAIACIYLSYFNFSVISQFYLLLFTAVFTYQIAVIAGKIGIAPLGRFATFVMVPAMFLFSLDMVQIVMIATFVEVCGGVTADVLFGRKAAHMAGINRTTMMWYQYLGLAISSVVAGIVFWVLINHLHLGSDALFAQKAQSRKLLIHAQQFNWYVLLVGAVFGFFLDRIRINSMLVLGGLLMPLNMSISLVFGGFLTTFVKKREDWEPFWSGVFTANSMWMIIRAVMLRV